MTKIKRLKLSGFKSFANETVINFEKGFNTIVGANGSGKSNVFDALCFVLGRLSSKSLRADKLGNLVFNGGVNLKPSSKAEVSIYLSNENKELLDTDLNEIKISRIVTKKGKSDYFINNNKSTRTQILELLSKASVNPDGYNIVLQGDIMKIVNMNSNERRGVVEEISNISGYSEKRDKASRKLEKIDIDLDSSDLLLNEKTKYIKGLKDEKEAAVKYRKTKQDLEFSNLLSMNLKIKKNEKDVENSNLKNEKNEENIKIENEKLENLNQKIQTFEKEIEEIEIEIEKKSRNDYTQLVSKITELEITEKTSKEKINEYTIQIENSKKRENEIIINISQIEKKKKEMIKNLEILENEKKRIEKNLETSNSKIEDMKSKTKNYDFSQLEEIEKNIEELYEKKENKTKILHENFIQIEKLNNKLEIIEEEENKQKNLQIENKGQVKELFDFRKQIKSLIMIITKEQTKNEELSLRLNSIIKQREEFSDKLISLETKQKTSNSFVSQNRAVSEILNLKKTNSDIFGMVSNLISTKNKYQTPIETLCGRQLFSIVVKDSKTAISCIKHLKESRIGLATFLPVDKINRDNYLNDNILNQNGVIDYAINLIDFDKKYTKIMNLIFGDTLVIDSIENAKKIGIGKYKMISLDGDIATKTGSLSGGFRNKKQNFGILGEKNLSSDILKLNEKINNLNDRIQIIQSDKTENEELLYSKKTEKMEVEAEILKLEKILSINGDDNQNMKNQINNLVSDKSLINNSLKIQKKDILIIETQISKLNKEKENIRKKSTSESSLDKLNELEKLKDNLRELLVKKNQEIESGKVQKDTILENENKTLLKIKNEIVSQLENLKNEILKNKEILKNSQIQLKENREKEKKMSAGFEGLKDKKEDFKEKKKVVEKKFENLMLKINSLKDKSSQIRYQIEDLKKIIEIIKEDKINYENEIQIQIENKIEKEDYLENIEIEINEKMNKEILPNLKELQQKVNSLKMKLNSFGTLNLKAVELYDKLKEEFNILLEKRESLQTEKNHILKFIEEIDILKKEKFMDTFKKIEKNFVEIYNTISKKGKVELSIEDEKDLFNSGVDIRVRLSSKNYLDIKSLSGGEKTITAIAFIFAIQEFSPASFYILDEIDAALDIMNSELLGKLINKYSNKAQYICVSHSEHFIQNSDSIYGIVMNASKISSVASLNLGEITDYVDKE
jgi:chromosome segregation protein